MKKILNWVLAATLICGASVFTSCEKSDTVLSDKILGKWIVADLDGAACPTSWKSVVTFESAKKGYYSLSEITTMTWENKSPAQVTFSKDGFTAIEEDGTYKSVLTVTVNSITNKEMLLKTDWTLTGGSLVLLHEVYDERWVRVTDNFEQSVLGTWEAQVQNGNKQQTWRWEFKANGTYVFSLKEGDAAWKVFEDYVESIQGGKMKWTALRIDEDLTTHTETLELSKVQ